MQNMSYETEIINLNVCCTFVIAQKKDHWVVQLTLYRTGYRKVDILLRNSVFKLITSTIKNSKKLGQVKRS